jgi:two-component system, OmpR family, sensor histidine kinase SenX3
MLQDNITNTAATSRTRRIPLPGKGRSNAASQSDGLSALMLLAHDLRGPLSNLELLLEAIDTDTQSGDITRIAAKARRAEIVAQRITLLLASVLGRARNARDPLAPRFEPVDLCELIEESAAMNEATVARTGIELQFTPAAPLPVNADPQLVMEVLDNRIGNAIKHGKCGTTVTCAAAIEDDPARITVSDEGTGLSDARLFRPFTRLSRIEPGNAGSCGLGMWICRLIAEYHGGKITVSARADRPRTVSSLTIPPMQ